MGREKLDERTVDRIVQHLLERFGEPIGNAQDAGQGVADERGGHGRRGVPMKNRGFGEKVDEDLEPGEVNEPTCQGCGAMMPMESDSCNQCGMMASGMDEATAIESEEMKLGLEGDGMYEVTPPGREKQVKALKKQKGVKNPWAVSWASWNKSHKK